MMDSESDSEEYEDPVVNEVDVYLSQSLASNLYLLQYPLRPAHLPYESANVESARVRPGQQRVELDLSIRPRGENYSTSRGEHYARMVELADGGANGSSGEQSYKSGLWDKYTLTSEVSTLKSQRYVAAVFKDGQLHLSPLHGLVQLRPGLGHLDKVDTGTKKSHLASTSVEGDTTESEGEEAKPVTVRFAKREGLAKSQRSGGVSRKQNYQEVMEGQQSAEQWVDVEYYGVESEEATEERQLLFASPDDQRGAFSVPHSEYMNLVCPRDTPYRAVSPIAMPTGVLSLAQVKTLPLQRQVVELLRNAHIMQFSQLCSLLSVTGGDVSAVCEAVKTCAVLVQGCWVVASDIVLPGTENRSKRNARDYILWCFTQRRLVPRRDIVGVVKLSPEELREMLQPLAVPRVAPQQGSEFRLPSDAEFTLKYSSVVQQQEDKWRQRHKQLVIELGIKSPARHDSSGGGASGSKVISGEQLVKSAQKKAKTIATSETKEDTLGTSMRPPKLAPTTQLTPSRHTTNIAPQAIAMDTSPTTTTTATPMETGCEVTVSSEDECFSPSGPLKSPLSPRLSNLIKQATDNNGAFQFDVPVKQELPNADLTQSLVQFCMEALGNSVLGLPELRDKLLLKQASVEENHPLRLYGVPDSQLEEALSACGAIEVGQPSNRRLFALPNGNKCRHVILSLYQKHKSLRKKQCLEELSAQGVEGCDNKVVIATLRELCYSKGGQWRLTGT